MSALPTILATAISSGTISALAATLAARRKNKAEADSVVAANETVRLTTYQNIIADLDARISNTMASMRELENELLQLRADNRALRDQRDRLQTENDRLRQELDTLRNTQRP